MNRSVSDTAHCDKQMDAPKRLMALNLLKEKHNIVILFISYRVL